MPKEPREQKASWVEVFRAKGRTPDWLATVAGRLNLKSVTTSRDEYDQCAGTIVGHWFIGPVHRGRHQPGGKTASKMWSCVSRCGCVSAFSATEIGRGLSKTCLACRPGDPQPPHPGRVLSERALDTVRLLFEENPVAIAVAEATNMKGDLALKEWERLARPILRAALNRTGLPDGEAFGWRTLVRDAHYLPSKGVHGKLTVKELNSDKKFVTVSIHAKHGNYTFDVDIMTVRTDVETLVWQKAVHDAFMNMSPALAPPPASVPTPQQPAPVKTPPVPSAPVSAPQSAPSQPAPAPSTPVPSVNGAPGGIDVEALRRLQNNIGTVISVVSEMGDIDKSIEEARAKLAVAQRNADQTGATLRSAITTADQAKTANSVAQDKVDDLDRRLRNAIVDRDAARSKLDDASAAVGAAELVHAPVEAALMVARKELADFEAMKAEQLRQVGGEQNLSVLLKVLSQMGK